MVCREPFVAVTVGFWTCGCDRKVVAAARAVTATTLADAVVPSAIVFVSVAEGWFSYKDGKLKLIDAARVGGKTASWYCWEHWLDALSRVKAPRTGGTIYRIFSVERHRLQRIDMSGQPWVLSHPYEQEMIAEAVV